MTDFIFVESNTTGTGEIFVRRTLDMGYRPVLLTRDPARYQFLATPAGQSVTVEVVQTRDREELIRAVGARSVPPAGIFTSSDTFYGSAAWLAHQLGLPGADYRAIDFCRCKVNQRTALGELRPHLNPSWRAPSLESAAEEATSIGYPLIVKPCDGTGSLLVRKCWDEGEVAVHIERISRDWHGTCGHILLEEFIAGPEFSVEIFNGRLIGVTEKTLGPEPNFVEMGHLYPAQGPVADIIGRSATQVARDLRLSWGPVHIEMRASSAGPRIIEINPRLGGDFIPELIRLADGEDVIASCIRLAAGDTVNFDVPSGRFAAVHFLQQVTDGIATVTGISSALEMPFVREARLYHRDTYHRVAEDFTDRVGHIILAAPSQVELIAALSAASAAVTVSSQAVESRARSFT